MSVAEVSVRDLARLLDEWEEERARAEAGGARCALQDYDAALAALRRAMREAGEQPGKSRQQLEIARFHLNDARRLVAAYESAKVDLVGAMQKARKGLSIAPLTVVDLLEDTRRI